MLMIYVPSVAGIAVDCPERKTAVVGADGEMVVVIVDAALRWPSKLSELGDAEWVRAPRYNGPPSGASPNRQPQNPDMCSPYRAAIAESIQHSSIGI